MFVFDEVMAEHLASAEHRGEIGVDDPLEFFFAYFEKGRRRICAGTIDQDVEEENS